MFKQYSCNDKGKKVEKMCFFQILALKSYKAYFDHFLPEPCGGKNELFDKKNILPNLFLYYLKSHNISDL